LGTPLIPALEPSPIDFVNPNANAIKRPQISWRCCAHAGNYRPIVICSVAPGTATNRKRLSTDAGNLRPTGQCCKSELVDPTRTSSISGLYGATLGTLRWRHDANKRRTSER